MKLKTILFDLDGTLLPMDQDVFVKTYLGLLAKKLAPYGYDPRAVVDGVWQGTGAMVQNDGSRSNEAVFWDTFAGLLGEHVRADEPIFAEFYRNEFQQVQSVCGHDPRAAETVHALKAMGYQVALATNPLFPSLATESRIRWAGLQPEEFLFFTTYENSSSCKPNPLYYREVLSRIGCAPEECLMVGNDAREDMVAETLGMQVFLLTDCLLHAEGCDLNRWPHGSFPELMTWIRKHTEA